MIKIIQWNKISKSEQQSSLTRPTAARDTNRSTKVSEILLSIKQRGDQRLLELTQELDQAKLQSLAVTENEFIQAEVNISQKNKDAIDFAIERNTVYQKALLPKTTTVTTYEGVVCQRQPRAINAVGLYVPGGSAPLVSTVIMLAVPAKLAACEQRIMCTPPNKDGSIDACLLYAAQQCGIQQIFKVGGAQAIAALAYGTDSIPKVEKIFGPGNTWVTEAKKQIAQDPQAACIDMPAGPSEVLVIADDEADAELVAADLLSQAEHGVDSQVIAITFSQQSADAISLAVKQQLNQLTRKNIAQEALKQSKIIIVDSLKTAFAISNRYAPEHLILQINNAEAQLPRVSNAGSVFIGPWTPETLGDYVTGSNHVLPTEGYARAVSGLCVTDFMKYISIQKANLEGLKNLGPYAMQLASIEGLDAHKSAVSRRLEKINESLC